GGQDDSTRRRGPSQTHVADRDPVLSEYSAEVPPRRSVVGHGLVECWRANLRVRWHLHGFRRGPQSGSHSHVSSTCPSPHLKALRCQVLFCSVFVCAPFRDTASLRPHMLGGEPALLRALAPPPPRG